MRRAIAATITAILAAITLGLSHADAAVPGKPFTETDCTEFTDSVARLYTAGLGRQPERGGFEFWVDEYMTSRYSLYRMSEFFTQSPEFAQSYGDPSNREFVEIMYRNVLGREGETGGVAFWTSELDTGQRDRATVLLNFAESPENIQRSGTTQPALGAFNGGQGPGFWNCHNTNPGQPTVAQQNAIERAHYYLGFLTFSRSGLIETLELEFELADATYAVDSLSIDFNAQAVEHAAQALDFSPRSRLHLIYVMVETFGFTSEQAVHGTDAQGANWFRQAELEAQLYLNSGEFSCQALIDQLEYRKYTSAEATHGANSTGICS